MDAKKFRIGNKSYTQVLDGDVRDTDILFQGDLYREDQPDAQPANATPAPTTQPATTAPASTTTHHWYNGITPRHVLEWIAVLFVIALAIVAIIVVANIRIAAQQPVSPTTGDSNTVEESTYDVWTNHGTWSLGGPDSFGVGSERGSDLFTDPSKGSLTLKVNPSEPTCLLQYGTTQIYTEPFTASFTNGDVGAGFRVIAQSYWNELQSSDGAYNLCWDR